jgi:hypothetical protein
MTLHRFLLFQLGLTECPASGSVPIARHWFTAEQFFDERRVF